MRIGVVGTGNIGGVLTELFLRARHQVTISNSRGARSLHAIARETGATAGDVYDTVTGKDLIVVAIPLRNIPDLPSDLFKSVPSDTIVIDTSNYYPRERDGRVREIENGEAESAWVQRHLGHPVVKVFNSILWNNLLEKGRPAGTAGRVALAIAGDDASAKTTVMKLVDEIGFDSVDAGSIAESWRQQPGTPGYLQEFDIDGVRRALAEAKQERTASWQATDRSPGSFAVPT